MQLEKENNWSFRLMVSWVFVILWMALIFAMSAKPANQSNHLSLGVTDQVINIVHNLNIATDLNEEDLNHIVRKCAHFTSYFILALLVLNALRYTTDQLWKKRTLITLGICILYAASDEFHQIFVPGRGPQVKDVFIDTSGALAAIAIYYFFTKFSKRKFRRVK